MEYLVEFIESRDVLYLFVKQFVLGLSDMAVGNWVYSDGRYGGVYVSKVWPEFCQSRRVELSAETNLKSGVPALDSFSAR